MRQGQVRRSRSLTNKAIDEVRKSVCQTSFSRRLGYIEQVPANGRPHPGCSQWALQLKSSAFFRNGPLAPPFAGLMTALKSALLNQFEPAATIKSPNSAPDILLHAALFDVCGNRQDRRSRLCNECMTPRQCPARHSRVGLAVSKNGETAFAHLVPTRAWQNALKTGCTPMLPRPESLVSCTQFRAAPCSNQGMAAASPRTDEQ